MDKKYSQEEQNAILDKIMSGVVGTRKQGEWDRITKNTKFTKKHVITVASKYKYLQDFKTQSNGEFQYAERYGFLDELNLERQYNTNRDFEQIKQVAQKYSNRWEFQQNQQADYHKAKNEGWLDEICSHMELLKTEYTFEMCKEIGSQYSGRTDWYDNHQNSYQVALRNNWVEKIFPEVKKCGRVKQTFTKSQIIELAKKYDKRSYFRRGEQQAMLFAKSQGWLDDILNEVFLKNK